MQIHTEVVGEAEHDSSEGVACPTPLAHTQTTFHQPTLAYLLGIEGIPFLTVYDIITVPGEIG